ncbi:MAG: hypothetical protein R2747_17780 [Pyrinomonadaceae bacterium]
MNKPKFFVGLLLAVVLLGFSQSFAQPEKREIEPSYEVILQTLVASNDAADRAGLPDSLSGTVNKLKTNFAFANYRVVSTHLERISNKGSLFFRSVFKAAGPEEMSPISTSWQLDSLNSSVDSKGRPGVEFRSFSFEGRILYKTTVFNEKAGSMVPATGSDLIELKNQRFNVPENEPTVIGNLALPKSDKQIFLIITVKPT